MNKLCANCCFYRPSNKLDDSCNDGECYRFPPVLLPDATDLDCCHLDAWVHPIVESRNWCGEWQPKSELKESTL